MIVASVEALQTLQSNCNEIKRLKNSNELILEGLVNSYRLLFNDYKISGIEGLTNKQLSLIVLGELRANFTEEDEDVLKVLDVLDWFFKDSGLIHDIKPHEMKFSTFENLKKVRKFYTKSAVKALNTRKEIVTKDDYTKALTVLLTNAKNLKTAIDTIAKNDKALKEVTRPTNGVVVVNGKVSFDIPAIDMKEINIFNRECAIALMRAS